MRTLIFGGAGFIGTHLSAAANAAGQDVRVADDLSAARSIAGHRMVLTSTEDKQTVDTLVDRADLVFCLAGPSGARSATFPEVFRSVAGTRNVIDACARFDKRLILASSAAAYGMTEAPSLHEAQASTFMTMRGAAQSAFAQGELMKEALALDAKTQHGLRVTIARLFNVIGPRMRPSSQRLFPKLIAQALLDEPLTVIGDGQQTRAFTPVRSAVRALLDLARADDAAGEVVNVGGTIEASALAVARRIKQLIRTRAPIVRTLDERTLPEVRRRAPSLRKLKRLIGWAPQGELDTALLEIIKTAKAEREQDLVNLPRAG